MCLILIAHRAHPEYRLVVAANRDEFHARPTAPADFWEDADILGGRDLQSGGTWLGITHGGRFAAVTNYREGRPKSDSDLSRGLLVSDFLRADASPPEYLHQAAGRRDRYAGFGLFVSDLVNLGYFSNREGDPRILGPGLYGLSNYLLDSDWVKVSRGKSALKDLLIRSRGVEELSRSLLELLAEHKSGAQRDQTIFVIDPIHGTRSSTVVIVTPGGETTFVERGFDPAGEPLYTRPFGFRGVSDAIAMTPAV